MIFNGPTYVEWGSENFGAKITTKFLHHEAVRLNPFLMGPRWAWERERFFRIQRH